MNLKSLEIFLNGGKIFSVGLFLLLGSCSSPNCENEKSDYINGYAQGSITRSLGGVSGSCKDWVDSYNDASGSNKIATDCFCDGFSDGVNGDESKL